MEDLFFSPSSPPLLLFLLPPCLGRVAAGAIAEKYLKVAHGIEIVAFVSSVGKIHLPAYSTATGNEEDDEPLSKEYVHLLNTVTREIVDKEMVRCPNREIAQKMEDVSQALLSSGRREENRELELEADRFSFASRRKSESPKLPTTLSEEPSPVSSGTSLLV